MTESVSESSEMFSQLNAKSCKHHDSVTRDQALEEKTLVLTYNDLSCSMNFGLVGITKSE